MTVEQLALAASVVFAGLWSGLLGMLTLVMHPMLAAMNGADFERFLRAFLPVARKAWFNYVCAIAMGIAPAVALVRLRDDPSSAPFVLTAIGLTIVIVGVYIVSNVWKEPLYDVMLAWDPEAMPAGWRAGRRRYFVINWIQAAATWTVFALFLVALIAASESDRRFRGVTLSAPSHRNDLVEVVPDEQMPADAFDVNRSQSSILTVDSCLLGTSPGIQRVKHLPPAACNPSTRQRAVPRIRR